MKAYLLEPLDKQTREAYGLQGLQPSTGGVSPVKNVQKQMKYDPNKRYGGRKEAGRAVVQYNQPAAEPQSRLARSNAQTAGNVSTQQTRRTQQANTVTQPAQRPQYNPILKKRKQKISVRGAVRTARGAIATEPIWAWGLWVWVWFQVPFAILSLVAMGLQQALYDFFTEETVIRADGDESWLKETGRMVSEVLISIAQWVFDSFTSYFNIDPNIIGGMFLMLHVLVLIVGWGTLAAAYLAYTFAGAKPLSGKSGGTKMLALAVAMICYSIPVFNIFPWFIFWTLVVLKNSK